jgi:hypothetical protein
MVDSVRQVCAICPHSKRRMMSDTVHSLSGPLGKRTHDGLGLAAVINRNRFVPIKGPNYFTRALPQINKGGFQKCLVKIAIKSLRTGHVGAGIVRSGLFFYTGSIFDSFT